MNIRIGIFRKLALKLNPKASHIEEINNEIFQELKKQSDKRAAKDCRP